MPEHEEHDSQGRTIPIDDSLIINTRLIEIQREQAEDKKRDAEYKQSQLSLNRRMVIFTGALVVATVIYAGITGYIAYTGRISADAAKSAANAQAQQPSPWVGVEQNSIRLGTPNYTWHKENPRNPVIWIPLSYRVTNYGTSPAFTEGEEVTIVPITDEPRLQSMRMCNMNEVPIGPGNMILPGETRWFKGEIAIEQGYRIRHLGVIFITLCITYQDSRGQWRHSGYFLRGQVAKDTKPVIVPGHPDWSFLPFDDVSFDRAEAN